MKTSPRKFTFYLKWPSFKYLLSTYYLPGTVLSRSWGSMVNKTDVGPMFMKLTFWCPLVSMRDWFQDPLRHQTPRMLKSLTQNGTAFADNPLQSLLRAAHHL